MNITNNRLFFSFLVFGSLFCSSFHILGMEESYFLYDAYSHLFDTYDDNNTEYSQGNLNAAYELVENNYFDINDDDLNANLAQKIDNQWFKTKNTKERDKKALNAIINKAQELEQQAAQSRNLSDLNLGTNSNSNPDLDSDTNPNSNQDQNSNQNKNSDPDQNKNPNTNSFVKRCLLLQHPATAISFAALTYISNGYKLIKKFIPHKNKIVKKAIARSLIHGVYANVFNSLTEKVFDWSNHSTLFNTTQNVPLYIATYATIDLTRIHGTKKLCTKKDNQEISKNTEIEIDTLEPSATHELTKKVVIGMIQAVITSSILHYGLQK